MATCDHLEAVTITELPGTIDGCENSMSGCP